jgi:DNA-directed RNA polymerase delta subunit
LAAFAKRRRLVVDSEDEATLAPPEKDQDPDESEEGEEGDEDEGDEDENVSEDEEGDEEEKYIDDEGAEDWDRVRSMMPRTSASQMIPDAHTDCLLQSRSPALGHNRSNIISRTSCRSAFSLFVSY